MICKTCGNDTPSLHGGRCAECANIAQDEWQKRMAVRMDAALFDSAKLINVLLTHHWMHECRIIPDYMPPFPSADTRPTCQIHYVYKDGSDTGLRYSKGPLQGFFWDIYGDDFHSPELALVALSQAPPPTRIDGVIPTHGV